MNIKNKNSGFTIIEILVVIAIIGLLSAIVLVGLTSFRQRGRDARRVADLRQAQNALELYYAKNSVYPDAANWSALSDALVNGGIGVAKIPNDPRCASTNCASANNYRYTTNGQNYILAARLEVSDSSLFNDSYNGNIPAGYAGDFPPACGKQPSGDSYYCLQF